VWFGRRRRRRRIELDEFVWFGWFDFLKLKLVDVVYLCEWQVLNLCFDFWDQNDRLSY
jgi:hypothetical protein